MEEIIYNRIVWADRQATVTLYGRDEQKGISKSGRCPTGAEIHIVFYSYQQRTGIWDFTGHKLTETRHFEKEWNKKSPENFMRNVRGKKKTLDSNTDPSPT